MYLYLPLFLIEVFFPSGLVLDVVFSHLYEKFCSPFNFFNEIIPLPLHDPQFFHYL